MDENGLGGVWMREQPEGDYVKWECYVALAAKCEALEEALRIIEGMADPLGPIERVARAALSTPREEGSE